MVVYLDTKCLARLCGILGRLPIGALWRPYEYTRQFPLRIAGSMEKAQYLKEYIIAWEITDLPLTDSLNRAVHLAMHLLLL